MSETEVHDAHHSKRGDFYQPLVAIKYAISEKVVQNFKKLTIEHDGDVTFDDILQIETKHHKNDESLGDKHEDFWKTLYNWLNQSKTFHQLILHTTAHFPIRGISNLKKWNSSSVDQRIKYLKNINFGFELDTIENYKLTGKNIEVLKNKGVDKGTLIKLVEKFKKNKVIPNFVSQLKTFDLEKDQERIIQTECKDTSNSIYKIWNYARFILSCDEGKLKGIIEKISISTNQAKDEDLVKELHSNPVFSVVPFRNEGDIRYLIEERLAGSIASKVVGESRWEVSRSQFYKTIQQVISQFYKDNYRPCFDKYLRTEPLDDCISQNLEKKFVKELREINCKGDELKEAIVDYWKTNMLLSEECEDYPDFYEDEYKYYKEKIIQPKLISRKRRYVYREDRVNNLKESLLFYRDAKDMEFQAYNSIQKFQYFEHGTMQNIVEDSTNDFNWILND